MIKYLEYIKIAIKRGYYPDGERGVIISPTGYTRPSTLLGSQRYASFTITSSHEGRKRSISFPVHKFMAYWLWKEEAFQPGIVVRHLDGNSSNNCFSNLALGTHSENQRDKPKEMRILAAKKARATQGKRPQGTILTSHIAEEIRTNRPDKSVRGAQADYIREMIKKYRVTKSTIEAILQGRIWK